MIKKIIDRLKQLDSKVRNIMINGFKFSLVFCIFSVLILSTYSVFLLPSLFYIGTILFKTSLMFFVDFIILGIGFDTIKKQLI